MRVLNGEECFAVEGETPRPATGEERSLLVSIRTMLDALLLGPLYRARDCERGSSSLSVVTREGARWTVHLDGLVPIRFDGEGGPLCVIDWSRSERPWMRTWIPSRASSPALGECAVSFEKEDLQFEPSFFSRRAGPEEAPPLVIGPGGRPGPLSSMRPPTPREAANRPMRWIVLDDPLDWEKRASLYAEHFAELTAQNQQIAGFAGFLEEDGRRLMVVPFRRREGGPEFRPARPLAIRDLPETRVLEVYPPSGSFGEKVAAGARMLADEAARRKIRIGPVLAQPFFSLQDGPPSEAKLEDPVVRLSAPLR